MNSSMPGLPVHHQLLEFTQTHVHRVGDAIQPFHPLSIPFSSHLQSFPASGSFQMSQLFALGGQSFGVSASTLVLPVNTQDWSPLGWTGWISLQSKGLSRVFSNTAVQTHQFFGSATFSLLFLGNFLIVLVCWEFSWKVIEFCQMPLQYLLRWHINKHRVKRVSSTTVQKGSSEATKEGLM